MNIRACLLFFSIFALSAYCGEAWLFGCSAVNCKWSSWGSWGSCSRTCGVGSRIRSRSKSPAASCGGSDCSGSSTQTGTCSNICYNGGYVSGGSCVCPVTYTGVCCQTCVRFDCAWGEWNEWGECSHECGGNGTQARDRVVTQEAFCGGDDCTGLSQEQRACNRFCDNGGTPTEDGCLCSLTHHGKCCESGTGTTLPSRR